MINDNTRRYWAFGATLALVMLAIVGGALLDGHGRVTPQVAQVTVARPTAAATPTIAPAVTTTQTPTPVATPTVVYVSVISERLPDPPPRPGPKGKVWTQQQRALLIDQDAQEIDVYENGKKIKTIAASSGKPLMDHFTPAWTGRVGKFQGTIFSFGVYADEAWYLYQASGDILIHGAPYVYVNGEKVYQDLDALGHYPSSHGCIRIHPKDADWLTTWNIEGVPVVVLPWRGGFTE
jgi:lipoprotein-anchoring transpeptidase ErfK/SrfK